MKENVLAAWQADLKSGRHQQGEGYLRAWNANSGEWEYCCLGRLCELSGLGTWKEETTGAGTKCATYLGEKSYLPVEVAEWAGINPAHHDEGVQFRLGEMNDEGNSFYDIADDLPSILADYKERDVKP